MRTQHASLWFAVVLFAVSLLSITAEGEDQQDARQELEHSIKQLDDLSSEFSRSSESLKNKARALADEGDLEEGRSMISRTRLSQGRPDEDTVEPDTEITRMSSRDAVRMVRKQVSFALQSCKRFLRGWAWPWPVCLLVRAGIENCSARIATCVRHVWHRLERVSSRKVGYLGHCTLHGPIQDFVLLFCGLVSFCLQLEKPGAEHGKVQAELKNWVSRDTGVQTRSNSLQISCQLLC